MCSRCELGVRVTCPKCFLVLFSRLRVLLGALQCFTCFLLFRYPVRLTVDRNRSLILRIKAMNNSNSKSKIIMKMSSKTKSGQIPSIRRRAGLRKCDYARHRRPDIRTPEGPERAEDRDPVLRREVDSPDVTPMLRWRTRPRRPSSPTPPQPQPRRDAIQ